MEARKIKRTPNWYDSRKRLLLLSLLCEPNEYGRSEYILKISKSGIQCLVRIRLAFFFLKWKLALAK